MQRSGSPRAAFSLLELLIVITMIAVLATILLGAGWRVGEAGRVARTKAELAALSAALETYRRAYGAYPQTTSGCELLQALIGRRDPQGATIAGRATLELARFATHEGRDPFVDAAAQLIDPWGHPFRYRCDPAAVGWRNPTYVLWSAGPDGRSDELRRSSTEPAAAEALDDVHVDR